MFKLVSLLMFLFAIAVYCEPSMTGAERLKLIRDLYEQKVIDEKDYNAAKLEIIKELSMTTAEAEILSRPEAPPPPQSKLPFVPLNSARRFQYDIIVMPFINESKRKVATDQIMRNVISFFTENCSMKVCPFDEIMLYLGENNMLYDFQENPVNLEHIAEKFGAKYVVSGNIAALRAKKGLDLFKI
ncbi:MAG: hypothetical protein PHQ23_16035, partial [Candidatus Wallbacteria bacterium]|nr:hypothetical protein [Candidatus Wallbacteria bacterium]